MFLIFGISSAKKKLDFIQTILCSHCEQFGRLELFMTYTYLSLFFIPIFKWNRQFHIKSTCCNSVYSIDNSIGKRILKGEELIINEQDLHLINSGKYSSLQRRCSQCGNMMEQNFLFCPNCGNKL